MKILVIDVGGNNVKVSISARKGEPLKIPSGPEMTAAKMVAAVKKATAGWVYQAVSIGYPGPVVNGKPTRDPANLGSGWKGFDFRKAFGRRVRVVNDAAMQALGATTGAACCSSASAPASAPPSSSRGCSRPWSWPTCPTRRARPTRTTWASGA